MRRAAAFTPTAHLESSHLETLGEKKERGNFSGRGASNWIWVRLFQPFLLPFPPFATHFTSNMTSICCIIFPYPHFLLLVRHLPRHFISQSLFGRLRILISKQHMLGGRGRSGGIYASPILNESLKPK